jgi:hypothetical protein
MTTCHLATIPSRENLLKIVLESITPYVDHTFLALSGYNHIPTWLDEFKTLTARIYDNSRGDANKFAFINEVEGLVYIADDDLVYSVEYFALLQRKVNQYNCPISLHGKRYELPFRDFKRIKDNYRCLGSVEQDQLNIHIIGTGVMAFRTDIIRPTMDAFEEKNMSDVLFSRLCYKNNIPMVVIAHKAGIVRYLNPPETIWGTTKDYSKHNSIIKSFLK